MVTQTTQDTASVVDGNEEVQLDAPLVETPPENADVEVSESAPLSEPETARPDYSTLLADAPEEDLLQTPRLKDILARREESIRRRTEDRIARESSSNESVQNVLTNMLARAVETGDESEYRRVAAQALVWNRQTQLVELAQALPAALLKSYKLPAEVLTKALEARETLPPEQQWDGYVTALIDGAVEIRSEARSADIRREERARYDARLAAELKARAVESAPKLDAPPVPPTGSVATSGPTYAEWGNATRQQRAEWTSHGVEPRPN